MSTDSNNIETVPLEDRKFKPTEEFASNALVGNFDAYQELYKRSISDPEGFWAEAAEELDWFKKWDAVLDDSEAPFYKWFDGAKTNLYNRVDCHIEGPDRIGPQFFGRWSLGKTRVLTYQDVYREVCKFANGLKSIGIQKGDRVAIYLPMIPELVLAVLACARIGAVHTVIFAGFSAESIRDRVNDCGAKCVITADGGWRRGQVLPLKNIVDEALEDAETVTTLLS